MLVFKIGMSHDRNDDHKIKYLSMVYDKSQMEGLLSVRNSG